MRISLKRVHSDIRPRRRTYEDARLREARRQVWLEATRPRINL